jgi:hypothetical protein
MLDSTSEIRKHLDSALLRMDRLLELYDHHMRGDEDIDISDDKPIRLEPAAVYDSCCVGYDATGGRFIYSERAVIFATMHKEDCSLDEALEFLNANTFCLCELDGGPIFMAFGRIPAQSPAPSEACPET